MSEGPTKLDVFAYAAVVAGFLVAGSPLIAAWGLSVDRGNECRVAWRLHPLAASAVESWKKGNLTDRELTRYLTLPQSRNFPLAACLMEGRE